ASDDIVYTDVPVPEWGGEVRIGTMGGDARDCWELFLLAGRDENDVLRAENIRATLVALCAVDGVTSELLFTMDDVLALGKKSAVALDRVYDKARAHNRLSDKDIEDAEKNSEGDPSDGSGS
ncbi:hypothetical protein LCGC14_2587400, partial [marine sediment metagenome]